jgi:hypothetical protein
MEVVLSAIFSIQLHHVRQELSVAKAVKAVLVLTAARGGMEAMEDQSRPMVMEPW